MNLKRAISMRMTVFSRGINLLEILLAVSILAIAIIPLYFHFSKEATLTFETERIQMAEKILTSIKEEMTALPFEEFHSRTKDRPNVAGPFELTDGYYPVTLSQVLTIQRKYKDFGVVGSWTYLVRNGKIDQTMVQVDAKVIWNVPNKEWSRTKSFLLVGPR